MHNFFESPFGAYRSRADHKSKIIVGRFAIIPVLYGHSFDDCARYLLPDEGVDRLLIGSFCSSVRGCLIMAGNQGHRADWISFPILWCLRLQSSAVPPMASSRLVIP